MSLCDLGRATSVLDAVLADIDFVGYAKCGVDDSADVVTGAMIGNSMTNYGNVFIFERMSVTPASAQDGFADFGTIVGVVIRATNETAIAEHASNIGENNISPMATSVLNEIRSDIGNIEGVRHAVMVAKFEIIIDGVSINDSVASTPFRIVVDGLVDSFKILHVIPPFLSRNLPFKVREMIIS